MTGLKFLNGAASRIEANCDYNLSSTNFIHKCSAGQSCSAYPRNLISKIVMVSRKLGKPDINGPL